MFKDFTLSFTPDNIRLGEGIKMTPETMGDGKFSEHSQQRTSLYEPLVYDKVDGPTATTTTTASSWPLRALSAATPLLAILPLIALFV